MAKHLRKTIVENIRERLGPEATAADLYRLGPVWPVGDKKAGKRISQRSLRYMFDDSDETSDPGLNMVAGIASALGCEVWELLIDQWEVRVRALARALGIKGTLPPLRDAIAAAKSADPQVSDSLVQLLTVMQSSQRTADFAVKSHEHVESPETGQRKPPGERRDGTQSPPVRGRRTR